MTRFGAAGVPVGVSGADPTTYTHGAAATRAALRKAQP